MDFALHACTKNGNRAVVNSKKDTELQLLRRLWLLGCARACDAAQQLLGAEFVLPSPITHDSLLLRVQWAAVEGLLASVCKELRSSRWSRNMR